MRLLRDILGPRQELVILQLSISTFAAAAFALCALGIIYRGGTPTQSSLPEHHVSFVSGPTTRGTVNLISSCVTTIFNCVYVSVHVDLPNSTKSTEFRAEWEGVSIPKSLLDAFFFLWDLSANPLVRRVFWMLFNIDAPEIVMYVAMLEYLSAAAGKRFMHAIGDTGWTMTHAFFADMGGFEVEENEGGARVFSTGEEFYKWRLAHPNFVLNLETISEEIADRSKSSGLLKLMTCTQASWLVVQTVMRLAEGIPVSELEILTCAYITCALVVYGFWWHKPYDVRRRVVLRPQKSPCRHFTAASSRTMSWPGGIPLSKPCPSRSPVAQRISNFRPPKVMVRVPRSPYEKPRITPFNRAFEDPDSSWLCMFNLSTAICDCSTFLHRCQLLHWTHGRNHGINTLLPMEYPIHQQQRPIAMASWLCYADCTSLDGRCSVQN